MKIIRIKNQEFIKLEDEICAAIGNFDGVHLGHQILINQCKLHNYKSAVMTFSPHPSIFLKNLPNYPLLTPIEHKIDIIDKMNIDYLIIIEFDLKLAVMPKEVFIKKMKFMNIKSCVCGYDFTFGSNALGTVKDLEREFEFYEIPKHVFHNVRVSSTYIRELISYGNVTEASIMLGRRYSIRGKVVYGNQVGAILGFPTANIDYGIYFLPKNGVYLVKVKIDNKDDYLAMANIGYNPTLNFVEERRLEVHIMDFSGNLYGHHIEVFFYQRIRSEKKFNSKEELLDQLYKDKQYCIDNVHIINLEK